MTTPRLNDALSLALTFLLGVLTGIGLVFGAVAYVWRGAVR